MRVTQVPTREISFADIDTAPRMQVQVRAMLDMIMLLTWLTIEVLENADALIEKIDATERMVYDTSNVEMIDGWND